MLSNSTINTLEQISKLESGWNGYGSLPISEAVLDNTKILLNCINFETQLFPTGCDSIQIEYFQNNYKDGIEIEVFDDGANYSLIKNGDYIITEAPISIEDAVALLAQFYYG